MKRSHLGLAAVLFALGAACGGSSNSNSSGGTSSGSVSEDVVAVSCGNVTPAAKVSMSGMRFSASSVAVKAGDVVMWTNEDSVPHTVTSGRPGASDAGDIFDSGNISTGQSFCYQFKTAGSFPLFCRNHPTTMQETVVVSSSSASGQYNNRPRTCNDALCLQLGSAGAP